MRTHRPIRALSAIILNAIRRVLTSISLTIASLVVKGIIKLGLLRALSIFAIAFRQFRRPLDRHVIALNVIADDAIISIDVFRYVQHGVERDVVALLRVAYPRVFFWGGLTGAFFAVDARGRVRKIA